MLRGTLFAALLLTALTMGLEFAHVLEWAPKASYSGPLYTRLQESLYDWYGNIGAVIFVLAVICALAVAVLAWRAGQGRGVALAAAVVEVTALVVFLTVVLPVNAKFPVHGSGAVPAGWQALRDRWEAGHATGFVLFAVAFVLLLGLAMGPSRRADASYRRPLRRARDSARTPR